MPENILLSLFLAAPAFAAAKAAKPAEVMMRVDGVAITREAVAKHMWKRYASQAVNELADEILVAKAAREAGVSVGKADVDERVARLKSQFPDDNAFQRQLGAMDTSLAELRGQIEAQLLRERLVLKSAGLKVTDAEAKLFFEAHKDELGGQESVHLRHILFKTEKEALAALSELRKGADFAGMASRLSQDPTSKAKGGDLGFIPRGSLNPEVAKTAFALKPGELGGPVKLDNGFHVLKAEAFLSAKTASFAEMKDDLSRRLLDEKISQAWPVYIKELRDKAKVEVN